MRIWVDDVRPPPTWNHCVWARTSKDAIDALGFLKWLNQPLEVMSLGGDDTSRPIVLWMCENDYWPESVPVHSMNPTGHEWLTGMVQRYHPNTRSQYER